MINRSSDRSFGILFSIVFGIVGILPIADGQNPSVVFLGVSIGFLISAWIYPQSLNRLNHIWFKFGLLLSRVTNPMILGMVFFGIFVPIGLLVRYLGKNPIDLKFDQKKSTYWSTKTKKEIEASSMQDQF